MKGYQDYIVETERVTLVGKTWLTADEGVVLIIINPSLGTGGALSGRLGGPVGFGVNV